MTIHGSKGLEFPVVILLKMTDTMMASETYDRHDYVA
jgi:ATP-dependent exoDNAse (exonuclease V) beta subunit